MEQKNIRQILQKFLLGTADAQAQDTVDHWYASFDEEAPVQISAEERAATRAEIWAQIEPGLGHAGQEKDGDGSMYGDGAGYGEESKDADELRYADELSDAQKPRKIWMLSRPMKAAAMVLLLAGAAGTLWVLKNKNSCQNCPIAYTTIHTGVGQKKKVTIQDGSQLTLDAGTTIRVQDDFSSTRQVEIVDGQVFFDIQKDERKPFVIHSAGLSTTVLGTSFSISAYAALNNCSIGVVSGKVRVDGATATLGVLEKDEELVYNKASKGFKKIPLDESMTAWREGRLLLNDLSFAEVGAVLTMNYGIGLATDDASIKNTRYTTELLAAMSPAEAVEVLAAIHNLRITKKDKTFFLHK